MLKALGLLAMSGIYVRGGWNQMNHAERYSQTANKAGFPAPPELVKASAWLMILSGIGLQLPLVRKLAAVWLVFNLGVITWIGHRWWEQDGQTRDQQMTQFLKNAAMAGGALYVLADK
jgi:uncharacterized membrane protein YphA (DoxX/SURF4 family)